MINYLSPRCTAALLAVCLSACAGPARQDEASYGRSVRATLATQILHPEAVRNANPVSGMDGAAALSAHQKYERSFSKDNANADSNAPLVKGR